MRWSIIGTLYKKEMLETLRDRRTLVVMVLLPILLYPLLGLIMVQARLSQAKKIKATRFVIGVVGEKLPDSLTKRLQTHDKIKYLKKDMPWKKALRKGKDKLLVVLKVSRNKHALSDPKGQVSIELFFASAQKNARAIQGRIRESLKWYATRLVSSRVKMLKLPKSTTHPIVVKTQDVSSASAKGRHVLSTVFPLMLIIMTITGAFYPAIDLTAGEKERGTLETLLTAPLRPFEIVIGKYLTVSSIATITGGLNILSLWLTMSQAVRLAGPQQKFSLGLDIGHALSIFGYLLLVAAFAAAFMMAIASLARSFKEAQNFVTPAYLVAFIPVFFTSLPGAKASLATALIPLVNTSYAIRNTLDGGLTTSYLLLTLFSMAVATALILKLASHIFSHEQVLFRDGDYSLKSLFSRDTLKPRAYPTLTEGLLLICVQFLLLFYMGMYVQRLSPMVGLLVTLWGIILVPPLFFAYWRKLDFRKVFALRPFPPVSIAGLLLIMAGAIPLIVVITHSANTYFFSGWQEFAKAAEQFFTRHNFQTNSFFFFFLIAVSPAICEEILFRGFIQSTLLRYIRPSTAILITALLFGAFHLSIYRMIPTTLAGLLLGWMAYRSRSIFPAMIAHALNNSLAVLLAKISSIPALKSLNEGKASILVLTGAAIVFVAGMAIFFYTTKAKPETEEPAQDSPEPEAQESPKAEDPKVPEYAEAKKTS